MTDIKILDVMGHRVDLDRVENPVLRRVIEDRIRYNEFSFWYRDHSKYTEEQYSDHREKYHEHQKYGDYNKYKEHKEWGDFSYSHPAGG